MIVGKLVNHFEEGAQSFRVAIWKKGVLENITEEEFAASLDTSSDLRGMQILSFAFMAGVVSFACVVIFLYFNNAQGANIEREVPKGQAELLDGLGEVSILPLLSFVHTIMAIACWSLGFYLYEAILRRKRFGSILQVLPGIHSEDPQAGFWVSLRGAFVIKIAMLQAPALFGLIICLLAILSGDIYSSPLYWLNTLSAVVLVLYMASAFPTRDRIVDVFRMMVMSKASS